MDKFLNVQLKFEALSIQSFGADLPSGKIHWTDAQNRIVAHGNCKAIISFAGTNRSYVWLNSMSQYDRVPTLPMRPDQVAYVESCTEVDARMTATLAAIADGADYLYAAPVGGGGFVYLAVYDLQFSDQAISPQEDADRSRYAWQYIVSKVEMLMELHGKPEFAAPFQAFLEDLDTQAESSLRGLNAATIVKEIRATLADATHRGGDGLRTALYNARVKARRELGKLG